MRKSSIPKLDPYDGQGKIGLYDPMQDSKKVLEELMRTAGQLGEITPKEYSDLLWREIRYTQTRSM